MVRLQARHGPVRLSPRPAFESLVDAIVSQQISGKAADAILARLRDRVPLEPAALARANLLRLRGAGLSKAKAVYVRELGRFADQGGLDGIERLDDHEVIERLTSVKGIGVWTAEMFLIFSLNREDVWPIGDGGVQRAARTLYRVRTSRSLQRLGERFRPYRTHAAWYLWRSLDES
jgi:DNA-3-methyladenine glycosylase II